MLHIGDPNMGLHSPRLPSSPEMWTPDTGTWDRCAHCCWRLSRVTCHVSHFVTPIARCVEDQLSNQCGHLTIRWLEVGIIYISFFRDQRLWFNSTSSSPLIFLINLILMDTPFSLCNCRVGPQYPGLLPRAAHPCCLDTAGESSEDCHCNPSDGGQTMRFDRMAIRLSCKL